MPKDYDVWFGPVRESSYDWRQSSFEELDDDEELFHTPEEVTGLLGFDPAELAKAFDPNQPRDEEGRWARYGGSSAEAMRLAEEASRSAGSPTRIYNAGDPGENAPPITVMHGTSSENIAGIMKYGLKPKGGLGADSWATAHNWNVQDMDAGTTRAGSVFLSHNKVVAETYAKFASDITKGTPVLLAARIPAREYYNRVLVDEASSTEGLRFVGTIKPEWIVGEIDMTKVGETVTVYIVVLVDEGKDLEKAFNPNQPRDDKGKWSTVPAYHGTSTAVIDAILEKGLVVTGERTFGLDEEDQAILYRGERGQSVYVTKTEWVAKDYAENATNSLDGKPLMLEIRIPQEEWDKNYVRDEEDRNVSYRTTKTIKPEWIVAAHVMEPNQDWVPYPIGKAAGQLVFVVLDLKEWAEDTEKAFNPGQARVPAGQAGGGQWTSGAGGGGLTGALPNYAPQPARSATELYLRTYDPNVTVDQVLDAVPGAREKAAEAERMTTEGVQTQTQYLGEDGRYVDERVAVHDEILGGIFNEDAVANARPAEGEKPVFTVLGGRGGSGKSWFTDNPDSPVYGKSVYLNSDDIKAALPEYAGWNAGLLHEESSDIVGRANYLARSAGLNVIFDATMRSTGTIDRMINEYQAAGYRIDGFFMHAAPQVAAVRATSRFVNTGRYVPASYVLSSTSNETSFDAMSLKMDNWGVYDNNSGNGPVLVVGNK